MRESIFSLYESVEASLKAFNMDLTKLQLEIINLIVFSVGAILQVTFDVVTFDRFDF